MLGFFPVPEVSDCTLCSVDYRTFTTTLTAGWPGFSSDGFCRSICDGRVLVSLSPYTLFVNLISVSSRSGNKYGHPGIMYNVHDMNNYDFVYIR